LNITSAAQEGIVLKKDEFPLTEDGVRRYMASCGGRITLPTLKEVKMFRVW
jgi:hypothetical protein